MACGFSEDTRHTTRMVRFFKEDAIDSAGQVLWRRIGGIMVVQKARFASQHGMLVVQMTTFAERLGIPIVQDTAFASKHNKLRVPKTPPAPPGWAATCRLLQSRPVGPA